MKSKRPLFDALLLIGAFLWMLSSLFAMLMGEREAMRECFIAGVVSYIAWRLDD